MAHLGNANVSGKGLNDDTHRHSEVDLERAFWNIWRPDEDADLVAFPKYRLPVEIQFYNRTQDSDGRINGMSVLAHSATDESKRMLDGRVGGLPWRPTGRVSRRFRRLKTTITANGRRKPDGRRRIGQKGTHGCASAARGGHVRRAGNLLPKPPSSASRAAVYDRMKAMDTKNKPDVGAGYRVSVPFWGRA